MKLNRRSIFGLLPLMAATCAPVAAPAAPASLPLTTDWKSARWIIMPDIRFIESQSKTHHNNCWTIHHQWMMRTTPDEPFFGECVHVNSRRYREWLAEGGYWESENERGIPPHIQFGGAVVAGPRDPTFKQRWVEYARQEFV